MKKQIDQQCHSTCMTCCKEFRTTAEFDRHRTGRHGLDRRCLTSAEMLAAGWAINDKLWRSPITISRANRIDMAFAAQG